MSTVYVIKNKLSNRYYTGYTSNIFDRIKYHNSGANRSTRSKGPWELVYVEHFKTKKEAWLREKQIKSYKGGEAFKKLIHGGIA